MQTIYIGANRLTIVLLLNLSAYIPHDLMNKIPANWERIANPIISDSGSRRVLIMYAEKNGAAMLTAKAHEA